MAHTHDPADYQKRKNDRALIASLKGDITSIKSQKFASINQADTAINKLADMVEVLAEMVVGQ